MNKIITLYHVYCDILLSKYWLWRSRRTTINGLALMFHHITDEKISISGSCRHTIEQFRQTLLLIQKEGYRFVSVDEAHTIIKNKSSEKFAVLTFDDVPENVYTNAYPILTELKIPFILFVSQCYIDKPGYLSSKQIIELDSNELCIIGAHTLTHPLLRLSIDSVNEIKGSKRALEKLLGHKVDYFAYPYGKQMAVSRKTIQQVKQAGFTVAFGTIDAPISDYTSQYIHYLPRVVIE